MAYTDLTNIMKDIEDLRRAMRKAEVLLMQVQGGISPLTLASNEDSEDGVLFERIRDALQEMNTESTSVRSALNDFVAED